jgi:hypothetical protein
MSVKPEETIGEAICASLLMQAFILRMIQRGLFPKDDAILIVDSTLLLLEKGRQDQNGPGAEAIDYARERLEFLLRQIQAIPQ